MMPRDRWVLSAFGALALAVLFLAWSAIQALRITPTANVEAPRFASIDSLSAHRDRTVLRVAEAVNLNVFAPDRTAPITRYSLTGEPEVDVAVEEPAPVVLPEVLGTAVGENSFAMCQLNGAPSVLLRVGDTLGDYTVRSISRGAVEFSTPSGERVTIAASSS
jgi:hypothetical protein